MTKSLASEATYSVGTNGLFGRKSPQSGDGFPVCPPGFHNAGRPVHLQNGLFGRNDLAVVVSLLAQGQLSFQFSLSAWMAARLHVSKVGMTKSLHLLSHLSGGDSSNPLAQLKDFVFFKFVCAV